MQQSVVWTAKYLCVVFLYRILAGWVKEETKGLFPFWWYVGCVKGNDQWKHVLRKECGLEISLREGNQKCNRQEKARAVVTSN